jgi:integrase
MGRPRTPIGTFGKINFTDTPTGRVAACARYRDWDGTPRRVKATGDSKAAAERALRAKLGQRALFQPGPSDLTPDHGFPRLVDYWVEDMEIEARLSVRSRQLYERNMRKLVLPYFEHLTLREIGVARCDRLIKQLARESYSNARHARVALRLAFGLAVRHEILPRNPMDNIAPLRRDATPPEALTDSEVDAVRAAVRYWETGINKTGPKPDGQLGQIVEVMLGTSARIGEVLAIRRSDLDITSAPPTLRIAGTIVHQRGKSVSRQDHPKTARSRRVIALPSFAAEALRQRLARVGQITEDDLVFTSRNGTPLSTHNLRRQLRLVLGLAGIIGVTPHTFRRTAATAINGHAGIELAAELLGHTDPRITLRHYIRRNEMVNPLTAALLDRSFSKERETNDK